MPLYHVGHVRSHKNQEPVTLALPDLKLHQNVRQEQQGGSRVESVRLDVTQLLLIYCLKSLWGLSSHVICCNNPGSVIWIAVK